MPSWRTRLLLPLLLLSCDGFGQRPVISAGGVLNAASFAPDPNRGILLIGGGVYSIFGQNLAVTTATAFNYPLPMSLAGTAVTVNSLPAPLFYVSPSQINFQVPSGRPSSLSGIIVTTPRGSSEALPVPIEVEAPGIFTQNGTGCGPGAVQNVSSDGKVTLNTSANSASPGDYVSVYGTGQGPVYFPPPDGSPASGTSSWFPTGIPVRLGLIGYTVGASLRNFVDPYTFAGRAPGLVGVDQFNFRLPENTPEGCSIPVRMGSSQPVSISVKRGGGRCQDAPSNQVASIVLKRLMLTGPNPGSSSTSETLEANFVAAPENQLSTSLAAPRPGLAPSQSNTPLDLLGPYCPGSAGTRLNAGVATLQTSSGQITVSPKVVSGEVVYKQDLPQNALQPGTVRLSFSGGETLGPFQTTVTIPPAIQITSPPLPGSIVANNKPFTLSWLNGSSDTIVRVRVVSPDVVTRGEQWAESVALGSAGSATIPLVGEFLPNVVPTDMGSVVVMVTPREAGSFTSEGLSRPGNLDWTNEYRFSGLRIRSQN